MMCVHTNRRAHTYTQVLTKAETIIKRHHVV